MARRASLNPVVDAKGLAAELTAEAQDADKAAPKNKPVEALTGRFGRVSMDVNVLDKLDTCTPAELVSVSSGLRKELDGLYKAVAIMNRLAIELDIYKATDSIRSIVLEILNCESVTLFLLDNENKALRARVAAGSGKYIIIQTAVGEGIAGTVAQSGISMNIPDAYACSMFNPAIDRATGFITKSLLCCPVADISGKHVAVIQAVNKLGGTEFLAADEANLELFGVHLGNTLTKSRLYTSIMFEKQRLEKLNNGIREINHPGTTLDTLVACISRAVSRVVLAEGIMLFFVDQPRSQLWTRWRRNPSQEAADWLHVEMSDGMIGAAATTGRAQCAREVTSLQLGLHETALGRKVAKCVLCQPVLDIRNGKVLAVICCINKHNESEDSLFSEPNFTINDENAMAVFGIEVARVLSERSLEISFANALSTVSSTGANPQELDLEAALQAQLMSYSGLEELESVATSIKIPDAALAGHDQLPRNSITSSTAPVPEIKKPISLYASLEEVGPPRASSRIKSQLARLRHWDLDIHTPTKEELMKVVFDIFSDAGVLDYFKIEERPFMIWVSRVCSHYRDNPYHNWWHVVHVLHCVHVTLMTTEANKCITRIDQLALLIAALCHDIDHDGKTNGFHVATVSELARCYNDISVLENHHCALTFAILNSRECNLLAHMDKSTRLEIRKIIISTIMATDMSGHFSLTTDFRNHAKEFSYESPEDRMLLCKAILHAADLSNPTLPFEINAHISQNVHREFKMQVESELSMGLTPMPHMNAKDEHVQCLLEISFIDAVVVPLWEHLAMLFPRLQPCLAQIHTNRLCFNRLTSRRTASIKEAMQVSIQESAKASGQKAGGPAVY